MRIMLCKRVEDYAGGYVPCVASQRRTCSWCAHEVWISNGCIELLANPDNGDIRTTCEVCYPKAKGELKEPPSAIVAPTLWRDMPPSIRALAESLGLTEEHFKGAQRIRLEVLDRTVANFTKKRGGS